MATAPSEPTWPETTPVTRLRSMHDPGPALAVEEELDLGRVGPALDHAAQHAGGAEDGRVQLDPVLAALVDGERAVPGKAVAAHHLRGHRLQGQDLAQAEDLAQALRLAGLVLPLLEQELQVLHALLRAAGSPRGRRAGPRSRSTPPSPRAPPPPPPFWRGERSEKTARWRRDAPPPPSTWWLITARWASTSPRRRKRLRRASMTACHETVPLPSPG